MFRGSFAALITPFKEDGSLDLPALETLVSWHVEEGTDVLVVCGTTGESPTLSEEEHLTIFEVAIKIAAGRMKVVAGTGTYDTRKSVERTEKALRLGADAALVVIPYYSRPTFAGCLAHFREIGKVGLPTIIYYHPGRAGIRLTAEQLGEIGALPGMAGIKDASGAVDFIETLQKHTSLPIYSGDDTLALEHLKRGAKGVVSIVANIVPRRWKEMIHLALEGRFTEAEAIYTCLLPLCQSLVIETNPQGVKYAAHLLGKVAPYLRLPLIEPRPATKQAIAEAMQHICHKTQRTIKHSASST